MAEELAKLTIGFDTSGIDKLGKMLSAAPTAATSGIGGSAAGFGAIAGTFMGLALGVLKGIKSLLGKMVESSPMLQNELKRLHLGLRMMLMPIGNTIALLIRPFTLWFLRVGIGIFRKWKDWIDNNGLKEKLSEISDKFKPFTDSITENLNKNDSDSPEFDSTAAQGIWDKFKTSAKAYFENSIIEPFSKGFAVGAISGEMAGKLVASIIVGFGELTVKFFQSLANIDYTKVLMSFTGFLAGFLKEFAIQIGLGLIDLSKSVFQAVKEKLEKTPIVGDFLGKQFGKSIESHDKMSDSLKSLSSFGNDKGVGISTEQLELLSSTFFDVGDSASIMFQNVGVEADAVLGEEGKIKTGLDLATETTKQMTESAYNDIVTKDTSFVNSVNKANETVLGLNATLNQLNRTVTTIHRIKTVYS